MTNDKLFTQEEALAFYEPNTCIIGNGALHRLVNAAGHAAIAARDKELLAGVEPSFYLSKDDLRITKGNHAIGITASCELDEYRGRTEAVYSKQAVAAAVLRETERCARVCEKRAEDRFAAHGATEFDTNASHYGRQEDTYAPLDEEDEDCAAAIRHQ